MSGTAAVNLHMSMIVPTVDSSRWKEETERVGPALKAAMVRSHKNSSSWITHVAMLQEYGGKVLSTPANSSDADISAAALVEMLVAVQHNVLQGMSGIARGEKMINTNPDLCNLGFAFAKIKQVETSQISLCDVNSTVTLAELTFYIFAGNDFIRGA